MKIYTIIAGVNGVGKSSLTGALKAERNDLGYVIDIDKYAAENNCGAIKAGIFAIAKIDELFSKGVSFSQETTLAGQRAKKMVKLAKEKGYFIRLYYIGLNDCEESVKRIKNRVEKGGHNIPSEDVTRRYNNRFADLTKILPYCDETRLYDNDNGFAEVGEYKNGELLCKGDYIPQWLKEFKEFYGKSDY